MQTTAETCAPEVEQAFALPLDVLLKEAASSEVSTTETLEKIRRLQAEMQCMPQLEMQLNHHFAPGVYVRELVIPAGAVVVGKMHATEHISIMSKGRLVVVTEEGQKVIEAPCTMVAPRGTKRAVYALEETVFINVHPNPTNEKDLDKLEEIFIIPEKELLATNEAPLLVEKVAA